MRNALKTQEEALIYFLELLDIDMIDTLLENEGHTFTGNYNGWEMDKWNINFQFCDTNKKKDNLF